MGVVRACLRGVNSSSTVSSPDEAVGILDCLRGGEEDTSRERSWSRETQLTSTHFFWEDDLLASLTVVLWVGSRASAYASDESVGSKCSRGTVRSTRW